MTIFEAGIIAGALAGGAIGVRLGAHDGQLWTTLAGAVEGGVLGALAGWVFAMMLICLLTFVAVLWRAARKREGDPTESDMRIMTNVAVPGTFLIALLGLALLWTASLWAALAAVIACACLTALLAVGRLELQRSE